MEQTIRISGKDLMTLNPRFGPRFGPEQTVEVVYTTERRGGAWENHRDASGFMADVQIEDGKRAFARVHVYVGDRARDTGNRISTLSAASDTDTRAHAVWTLVHELTHVEHGWLHGGKTNFDVVYAKEARHARDRIAAEPRASGTKQETLQGRAYRANVFEDTAFRRADEFMSVNQPQVKSGAYDRFLPWWVTGSARPSGSNGSDVR